MMKFTIERKPSLGRSRAQNSAQSYKSLHVNPTNTFKVAFHFHRRATAVQTLRRMVHVYIRNDPLPTTDCACLPSPAVTFSY